MFALIASAIGAGVSGISKIVQGAQAKRAARRNYQRQQETLGEQYEAGAEQISQFRREGQDFLGSQTAAMATSGVKGSTLDLIRGTSESNLQKDLENLRKQNTLNYERGMEQAALGMETASQQATGAILGGLGGLASAPGNIYNQGVNLGVWTPGRVDGKWKAHVPGGANKTYP